MNLEKTFLLLSLMMLVSGCRTVMLEEDFTADPENTGWELKHFSPPTRRGQGEWTDTENGAIRVLKGYWASPRFEVEPLRYYRMRFSSMAKNTKLTMWAAAFESADGSPLDADHYSHLPASETWKKNEFYFRAKFNARSARILFDSRGAKLTVRQAEVREASDREVLRWADRLYENLPPIDFSPPSNRLEVLPQTLQRLQNGKRLRIVFLGDSIANDIGNSPFDKLMEREYPGSTVETITSVRSATGCSYYQEENRVEEYVLRYEPHLTIIAGISHRNDAEAVANVIKQIKENSDCEVMVMTGVITPPQQLGQKPLEERQENDEEEIPFHRELREVAENKGAEFFNARRAWDSYMIKADDEGYDWDFFMRDSIHANAYGRQAIARLLLRYFTLKK